MKIILFRHLDTIYSEEHRICGRTDCDILPGSRLEVPEEIMDMIKGERIRLFSSPLKRCVDTCEQLMKHTSRRTATLLPEFQERDWGPLQGMTKEQILARYGQGPGELRNSLPGIERDEDFHTRVLHGIELVGEGNPDVVAIVTHQGCLRVIYNGFGLDFKKFSPGEARVIEIVSKQE